ncbi:MAG: NAD-dependent epimerase/dehydratase family protein, partial [Actinomycetes bacterium]
DFVSVTTVAAAVARGVTARLDVDGAVNLASGSTSSILGLIDRLREVINRPLRVEHRPARLGEVRESAADISRLRAVLPELTDPGLEAGLRATVDWWLETQPHDGPAQ